MPPEPKDEKKDEDDIILLEDLAPRADVGGGARPILFGEETGDREAKNTTRKVQRGGR